MSEGAAPPPSLLPPDSPHGEKVTLDLVDGFNGYCQAMEDTLNRIVAAGYPGDPRETCNTMLFEFFNYLEGMLPNIDVREVAAFYGSVIGLGVGGHIYQGNLDRGHEDYLAGIFYTSMKHTMERAMEMHAAMAEAQEHGLVDADGNPLTEFGPSISKLPRPKARRRRKVGRKRKRKK